MGISEKILAYLSIYRKENKYRIATALKIDVLEVTKALKALEEEGKIEIKTGKVILLERKKARKRKEEIQKPEEATKEKVTEAIVKIPTEKQEEFKEQPKEIPAEEKPEEVSEELIQEERIEGTVKFFNPNKGFGFITGDDGEEYYVHKSSLKEGVTIEANNRVSFKVVQGDRGPKAEEVEWISQA